MTATSGGGSPVPGAIPPRGWRGTLVLLVVALFTVGGCASIPVHSPVGKSDPVGPRTNSVNISFQQFAPVDGSSPENIIRGFIDSGTGVSDDFQVAREYLTGALAQSWASDKRTLVYKNAFTVLPGPEQHSYLATFDVVSTVDALGVLTPADPGTTETLKINLAQVEGQWRISGAPDGVVLTEATFQTLFTPVSLYFYDPTFTYGVPDLRWLAGRTSRTATAIVRAMLAGPAPYLQGAVASAFPTGIALERDSVPVNNGLAKVGLTAQTLRDTSVVQRQQMHAQLLTTLQKSLSTVTELQFLADDRDIDMGGADNAVAPMVIDTPVPNVQVGLANNELVRYDGTTTAPIADIGSLAALAPVTPAISYSGVNYAFGTAGRDAIYTVSAGRPPSLLLTGAALTPPSFAPNGWVWTAPGDGSGTVLASDANVDASNRTPVVVQVPWLRGRQVSTLRISRDGSRALVISEANGTTWVSITGLVKSGEVPTVLTTPTHLVHSGNPVLGVWVGEATVALMAPATEEPVAIDILDLAAAPSQLNELTGAQWLSAATGLRTIHAQTGSELYSLIGNNWDLSAKELAQASFAG